MNYRRDLQIALRERYRRIYKANWQTTGTEFAYFADWVRQEPSLLAIIDAARAASEGFDPAAWANENIGRRSLQWPPTEPQRAVLIWHLVQVWADAGQDAWRHMDAFSSEQRMPDVVREAIEYGFEPLINYLEEQVGQAGDLIHLLARLQRRVEWFDRDELWTTYSADTRQGEAVYDTYLRRYLFDQGIDYPFSQPDSPSGSADVAGNLDTDDPLVCEVKLFDGDRYGPAYIGQGVQQALSYAKDFAKPEAYLVIFNLSDQGLELPTDDEPKNWPPRIHVDGVTVHMITVRAKPPLKPASKQGKPKPARVGRQQLVS